MMLKQTYDREGYVVLPSFFNKKEVAQLRRSFDRAAKKGTLPVGDTSFVPVNDVIFIDKVFLSFAKHRRLLKVVAEIFGSKELELQHAKFFNKPLKDTGGGAVQWHQDFAFFPHTNLDLAAVAIHLDDESEASGALMVIPRSHKQGALSHVAKGNFAYHLTQPFKKTPQKMLTCKAGDVTIHHSFLIHSSKSKTDHTAQRRILYFQYRTVDNAQLAGTIYKATGYPVTKRRGSRRARFMDGTVVELRGENGRLYDLYGKLAPDNKKTGHITSDSY